MNEQGKENLDEPSETTARRPANGKSKSNRPSMEASLNIPELEVLAELVSKHGFTDFEYENENIRVRLRKEVAPQIIQQTAAPLPVAPTPQQQTASNVETRADNSGFKLPEPAPSPGTSAQTAAAADEDLHKITSPIVGTFYQAPSPDAEPFTKIGAQVSSDSIVCIVEAMKLMNEIQAEVSGEIVKIYVENGQSVEYGQPLFGVRK